MLGQRSATPRALREGGADGLGLLPVATRFLSRKETHQVCLRKHPEGLLLRGYEIHSGGHYQLATTGLCSLRDHARSDGHTHSDDRAPAPAVFGTLIERDGRPVEVGDGAVSQAGRVWGTTCTACSPMQSSAANGFWRSAGVSIFCGPGTASMHRRYTTVSPTPWRTPWAGRLLPNLMGLQ